MLSLETGIIARMTWNGIASGGALDVVITRDPLASATLLSAPVSSVTTAHEPSSARVTRNSSAGLVCIGFGIVSATVCLA